MKKSFYFIVGLIGIMTLSSCTKTEIIENTINPNRTIWLNIQSSQWVADANTDKWSLRLNVPEIDGLIMDNGTVLVDISFDNAVFEPLTTVYEGLAYRYDYSLGELWIDVTWADGYDGEIPRPGAVTVKIILVDSLPLN